MKKTKADLEKELIELNNKCSKLDAENVRLGHVLKRAEDDRDKKVRRIGEILDEHSKEKNRIAKRLKSAKNKICRIYDIIDSGNAVHLKELSYYSITLEARSQIDNKTKLIKLIMDSIESIETEINHGGNSGTGEIIF